MHNPQPPHSTTTTPPSATQQRSAEAATAPGAIPGHESDMAWLIPFSVVLTATLALFVTQTAPYAG